MHVGGKGMENLLMSTMLKKTLLKKHKAKKIFLYASLLENKLNIFQFGIVEMITSIITTYEIKGCLAKIRVSNKVTLMNCHH
jgi:predicted transcriptional regulator